MALVNHAKKEINAKIVFFGPESAGKATNLQYIFSKLKESFRGAFRSMNLQNDRMLFFDFVPSGQGTLNGYRIRFHVYTITGEAAHSSSWKMILKGVDGLVFVADSAPARMAANRESLSLLNTCLEAYEKRLADIPCLIQCNKRDIPNASGLEEMGLTLGAGGLALLPADARKGEGVLESIFTVARMILKDLKGRGLELDRQAEQLHRMAHTPVAEEQPVPVAEEEAVVDTMAATPVRDAACESPAPFPSNKASVAEEEPVVEFAGEPEILRGGRLRLPLSIKYEGKEKKMALDISLFQDRD
jgi:signal recognition particle receptor subunit beta